MEWDVPNTTDTKFRLASITKQFTAILIMQLVEEGIIDFNGKLSDYLPYYKKTTGDKITIHHLLTHTSGILNLTNKPENEFNKISKNYIEVKELVKKYCSDNLEFEPGLKFSYSNSGYVILGAVIEEISGKPYDEVLKEKIFNPLGMENSGYDNNNFIIEKRASGYNKSFSEYENTDYLDMSFPYFAGSMYLTVEDLYLWAQALYTDKLLSEENKEIMFKPFLQSYAYGWGVYELPVGERIRKK